MARADSMTNRERGIKELQAGIRGEVDIHAWGGIHGPWMCHVAVKSGEKVAPSPGLGEQFERDVDLEHRGVVSAEELQARLDALQGFDGKEISI
jgi:hypothetical protein